MRSAILNPFMRVTLALASALALLLFVSSCGGGPDEVVIEGEVVDLRSLNFDLRINGDDDDDDDTAAGAEVCCFGVCDISGPDGTFRIIANAGNFEGGDVLCGIDGNPFILQSVQPNPNQLLVRITITSGVIEAEILSQDSNDSGGGAPQATPTVVSTALPEATDVPSSIPEATPTVIDATPEPETPDATPTVVGPVASGCALLAGSYSGNGGCQIGGTVNASSSGGSVSLSPFGSNGSASFTIGSNPESATSSSKNLILFGKPGHTCTLSCTDPSNTSFTLNCSNNEGGKCTEQFN